MPRSPRNVGPKRTPLHEFRLRCEGDIPHPTTDGLTSDMMSHDQWRCHTWRHLIDTRAHYADVFSMHRISAKTLGLLALPDSCPRCFWHRARLGWKSPWAIMPGIFSSIDGFSKRAVLAYHAKHGQLPPWLGGRWADAVPLPTPHHSRFWFNDPVTGIRLTGVPDLMLGLPERKLAILDLKTARYSDHQDALAPMYEVQLNGYAMIAESLGMGSVVALGLVYGEPPENDQDEGLDGLIGNAGFSMPFKATAVPVALDRPRIGPLLKKAKGLLDLDQPPAGREDCRDCRLVEELVRLGGKLYRA